MLDLINRLVDRLAAEVHRVEVPEADLLQESSWYQRAGQSHRRVLTSALASPARRTTDRRGPHLKTVEVADAESARLADKLAHAPFVVLVEDRESDGVLLEILVEELGWKALRDLWERGNEATPPAVEIATAGGIDAIPQRIERSAADAARQQRPLRLFVLCDSDARWPGDDDQVLERKMISLQKGCDKYKVPYKIWQKRCAESYIPDEVFEAVRDDPGNQIQAHRFDALLRRSPEQRDHFPVKDGLNAKERREAIEAGLYKTSEEDDLMDLETRLFPGRKRLLPKLNRKHRTAFTAEGLRRRDGQGEVEALLQAIAEEL